VTLVMHGQDDRTWLSLANPTGYRSNQHSEMLVRRVLTSQGSPVLPAEITYENQSAV
jgi:hypothetical protein